MKASHSFPLTQALNIVLQIGQTLHYLHRQGWWHGNLTSQTIYLNEQGFLRIKLSAMEPLHASPYQMQKSPLAEGTGRQPVPEKYVRQDQYALGALAYTLCTGQPILTAVQDRQPGETADMNKLIRPSTLVPDLSERVEQALLKALAPDPAQRMAGTLCWRQEAACKQRRETRAIRCQGRPAVV